MKLNVEKVDLAIQEESELIYTNELRKRIDNYFNKRLNGNECFNSYYSEKEKTLFLNFNLIKESKLDKIEVTLKIEKDD